MKIETYSKIFHFWQIALGILLFICMGVVFFAHAFHSPKFISFCLLALWVIAYKMLSWSIAEYRQEFKNNNSKSEKK